jgi:hypothetical protein
MESNSNSVAPEIFGIIKLNPENYYVDQAPVYLNWGIRIIKRTHRQYLFFYVVNSVPYNNKNFNPLNSFRLTDYLGLIIKKETTVVQGVVSFMMDRLFVTSPRPLSLVSSDCGLPLLSLTQTKEG